MKNQWKILLCLVLAVLAGLGTGCDKTDVPGEDTGDSTVVTPVVQDLAVVADGTSAYSIIIREEAADAAVKGIMKVRLIWKSEAAVRKLTA